MTVFLSVFEGGVQVMARLEGPGGLLGDIARVIPPGGEFMGYTHDELRAMGSGQHELTPKSAPPV